MTERDELAAKLKQAAEDALVQLYIQHPSLQLDTPAKVVCKTMFVMGAQKGAVMLNELIKS